MVACVWLMRPPLCQAMHLVYRALEKEPVPGLLPSVLVPPSKRKKSLGSVSCSVPVLPTSPPPPKDSLHSTPSHGSMNSLNSAGSLSPKHTLKAGQVSPAPPARRTGTVQGGWDHVRAGLRSSRLATIRDSVWEVLEF